MKFPEHRKGIDLAGAAYRGVGSDSNSVAQGDHTHPEIVDLTQRMNQLFAWTWEGQLAEGQTVVSLPFIYDVDIKAITIFVGGIALMKNQWEPISNQSFRLLEASPDVLNIKVVAPWLTFGQIDLSFMSDVVPVGSLAMFPGAVVTPGYLICDGSTIYSNTYPELVKFLTGDEFASSAQLPDYRGEFLRGADLGRGVDAGRTPGSGQGSEIQSHHHRVLSDTNYDTNSGGIGWTTDVKALGGIANTLNPQYYEKSIRNTGQQLIEDTGGVETRPRNVAVIIAIKAFNAATSIPPQDLNSIMTAINDVKSDITSVKTAFDAPAQAILKAALGGRPQQWTQQDCDPYVASMIPGGGIIPHVGYISASGIASASSEQDATNYFAWKAVTGTNINNVDCWISLGTPSVSAPAFWRYDFHIPRQLGNFIHITTRNDAAVGNPKDFTIIGVRPDGAEDILGTYTNQPAASANTVLNYGIIPVVSHYKALIIKVTATTSQAWTALGEVQIDFVDYNSNHVIVNPGLQVSFADNGVNRPSQVLTNAVDIDMSLIADGTYHVYADINSDGSFGSFGYKDVQPEVGVHRAGVDAMPGFTAYTLQGWGTVSASSEYNVSHPAWEVFDKVNVSDVNSAWVSQSGVTSGWLRCVFDKPRTLIGYMVRNRNDSGAITAAPKSWTFRVGNGDVPDTVVDTRPSEVAWANSEERHYQLASPVTCTSFELNITANNGYATYVHLDQITPLFIEDIYNPTELTHYDKSGNKIRRVYLGWVYKKAGNIAGMSTYSIGDYAVKPVNLGMPVAVSQRYQLSSPFLLQGKSAKVNAEIYHENHWGETGWVYDPTIKGYGTLASVIGSNISVTTGAWITTSRVNTGIGDFETSTQASVKSRVHIHRGY